MSEQRIRRITTFVGIAAVIMAGSSCQKSPNSTPTTPGSASNVVVITGVWSYDQFDAIQITGTIQSISGNETIVERGHYISLNNSLSMPILDSTKIPGEGLTGDFLSSYNKIKSNTKYYITGYAVTKSGKRFYGDTEAFESSNYLQSIVSGLMLYLPFNGNFNDSTSNANNATSSSVSFDLDRNNIQNGSVSFKNDSSYLLLSNPFDMPSNYSVSYWFLQYNMNPRNSNQTIFSRDSSFIFYNMNSLSLDIFPGISFFDSADNIMYDHHLVNTQSPWPMTVQTWYNITFTKNESLITLYLNGDFFSSWPISVSGTVKANNKATYIGRREQFNFPKPNSGFESFFGKLDDLRVFNRALSKDEVRMLYKYL